MDFECYVRRHGDALLRFAVTLTGDAPLAEEIVQDVLLRAFQKWSHVGELERPHAYVRRMIVNEHLSWRRRWSRVEPRAAIELPGVADAANAWDDRAALLAELARLSKKQRAVLAMRYFLGLPDAEIAETLECSPSTVRGIAARGLAKIRIQMADPGTAPAGGSGTTTYPTRDPGPPRAVKNQEAFR